MAEQARQGSLLSGSIVRQIIAFGCPLLLGTLFQQLYSSVDSVVVGRFVGTDALAAVGVSGPLVFLFVSFFQGIATGTNVVIAQCIGARREEQVRPGITTSLLLSGVGGVVMAALFISLTPQILRWMLTPADILDISANYLRVYLLSLPAIALYNTGTAVLRAMGDSRRPLYFLIISSVLNVALDLWMVAGLRMGVMGAALASVIAQFVSVALVFWVLHHHIGEHCISLRELEFRRGLAGQIVRLGVPTAIQGCAISLSNVLFQSQVNIFGSQVVAGYSAGNRINSITFMPCVAFGLASTTFTGQNYGAGQYDRIRSGARISMLLGFGSTLALSVIAWLLRMPLLRFFADDPAMVEYGVLTMLICGLPCCLWALPNIYGNTLVGMGKSLSSMLIILFNMCGVRLLWIFALLPFWRDVRVVLLSFPVSWITGGGFMMIYYLLWMRKLQRLPAAQLQPEPEKARNV